MKIPILEPILPEIPDGAVITLIGPSGSGKTVFSLQTLYQLGEEGVMLFLMDQNPKIVEWYAKGFGWNIGKLEREGKVHIFALRDLAKLRPENIGAFLEKLKASIVDYDISLVIFDAFSAVYHVIDSLFALRELLLGLQEIGRDLGTTFLLTLLPSDPYIEFVKRLSDVVIELKAVEELGIQERELKIIKAPAPADREIVSYSITPEGFVLEE